VAAAEKTMVSYRGRDLRFLFTAGVGVMIAADGRTAKYIWTARKNILRNDFSFFIFYFFFFSFDDSTEGCTRTPPATPLHMQDKSYKNACARAL
jgi:hypothetical protein